MNTKTTFFAATIASVLVLTMALNPAFAAIAKDTRGDAINPDFDIKMIGVNDLGNPYVDVWGQAGGTLGDEDTIYAYLLVTDAGTFVIASHTFCDSDEQPACEPGPDTTYHAHKVTSVDEDGCVTGLTDEGEALLQNKRAQLTGTEATTITAAVTATLDVESVDPLRICADPIDAVPNPEV